MQAAGTLASSRTQTLAMKTFTRTDSPGARLCQQLAADCGDLSSLDVSSSLDAFVRRHRRLPMQRLAALAKLEMDKVRYAFPEQEAAWRCELLSRSAWDHATAIVAALRDEVGEGFALSDHAIKRAFRRAVEQTRGTAATGDGPGALAVQLLRQALSRQSS